VDDGRTTTTPPASGARSSGLEGSNAGIEIKSRETQSKATKVVGERSLKRGFGFRVKAEMILFKAYEALRGGKIIPSEVSSVGGRERRKSKVVLYKCG